jgi:hypothetical protein
MSLNETAARAGGFGARRFLVERNGRLTVEQHSLLRPRYNEYPERVSLVEGFPAPGRRGPSRPAAAQGEGAAPSIPSGVYYPVPVERDAGEVDIGGALPSSNSPQASAAQVCAGGGGTHIQIGIDLATGSSQVNVSQRIDRPFKITYVEHYSDAAVSAKTQFRLKVAGDNSTTGGLAATGVNLDEFNQGGDDFLGDGQVHRSYPNKIVTNVPAYIKFCHDNQTGAQRAFQTIVNLEFLD